MKKNFILFVLLFLIGNVVFAAAPTVPSSNLSFSSLDGSQFSVGYTTGNGTSRIAVMKEGSPVTGVPVNGTDYTVNSVFGTAASKFTADGEYVVAKTSWNSFSVTNLKPGTTYYVAIFEYNGSGASTQYLMLPLTGSQSTVVAPTTQTYAIATTATTGNTITLNWSKGNGSGRLIIARKGSAVSATPTDLANYYAADNVFGNGTKLATDNYVVYKSTGTTTTIKGLEPNTTYYFSFFEYNGITYPVHLLPGAAYSAVTYAGPTVAPISPGFNYIEGNRMTIAVTQGNGTHRLFIAKKNDPVTAVPVNGVTYTANAAFGTAGAEIAPGEFVVATTTGNSINVTNLEPNTVYHFRVYEYDVDNAGNTYYLTSSYAAKSGSTATTPTTIASDFKTLSLTGSSATIGFTPGNGNYRMVLMKAGTPVDASPADLVKYIGNSNFGSGTQLGTGNYVVNWGMNGAQTTLNNLQPGVTYYMSVYEFRGYDYPVYSASGGTHSFTIPLEPTAASTSPWTAFVDGASFRLVWNSGNGSRRIVVAKKGSAVTGKPVDGTTYTANGAFGTAGTEMAPGEFVVYDGNYYSCDLANLEIGATYYFAVYEYNVGVSGPDYLTTSWLAASGATSTWPTAPTAISSVSGLQATQATINYTKGNGANCIFIMKQGSAVNVTPQDMVKYTANTSFGTSSTQISDGNYVVASTGGGWPFTVTNLRPNTTYYISAFEYNGSVQPAYLLSSPGTYSFTTPDVPGATVPTTAASSALINNVDGNKFTFKWTNGNGEKRIVVMKQGSAVSFVPANTISYTANASFGSGTDLGGGQYVVYNGTGSSVDLTNLLPSATYHFAVYEYNGTGTLIRYLTATFLNANGSTAAAPSAPVTTVNAVAAKGQVNLSWNNGNGSGRLVVMKEGSAVTAVPADVSVYPANSVFKNGSQIAAGEYVVYAGNSNMVTVTNLENKTYYFSIYEYNGSAAPVYNSNSFASGSVVVSSVLPVKLLYFKAQTNNSKVVLNWATAQEINNEGFVVERSMDGLQYLSIATIASKGNSSNTSYYTYTDDAVVAAKVFYRLKQVDADGKFTYSTVVAVSLSTEAKQISIYPNPVRDQFKISLPQTVNDGIMNVYDSKGTVVLKQKVVNGQYINSSRLTSGVYFVNVEAKGAVYKTTIIK
ncbi:MAG: T9SS type A sorting domain-containing protein [Flavisolibacter sp.]